MVQAPESLCPPPHTPKVDQVHQLRTWHHHDHVGQAQLDRRPGVHVTGSKGVRQARRPPQQSKVIGGQAVKGVGHR